MAIKLFGFTIGKEDEEPPIDRKLQGFATPVADEYAKSPPVS